MVSEDVLLHLTFMRYYFEYLKIIPKKIRSVPLPKGQGLSDEEFKEIYQKVLLLLGYSFDVEIQGLRCQLEWENYRIQLRRCAYLGQAKNSKEECYWGKRTSSKENRIGEWEKMMLQI